MIKEKRGLTECKDKENVDRRNVLGSDRKHAYITWHWCVCNVNQPEIGQQCNKEAKKRKYIVNFNNG